MDLADALIITGLGMAVVFLGLLLTAALIVVFERVQRLLDAPAPARDEPAASTRTPSSASAPLLAPDIVAVITAVLEVERRLHRIAGDRRFADSAMAESNARREADHE